MAERYTVADAVAEFLQASGVGAAFGIVSIHNMPMLDAIGRRNAVRFVMARGEAGAGSMADAYARVTGSLGALFTSTGPGAANAVGALVEARFAGSPVLHLTGQTATPHLDRGRGTVHDVPDQLAMLKSVSKAAYRVESPQTALGTIIRAATEAMTPPTGPVSVEIPIDVQRAPIPRPAMLENFTLPVPPPLPPAPAAIDALADMVMQARRPVLWTGSGARQAGTAVRRLVEMGFALVTSMAGRGVLPEEHPQVLGAFNNTPPVEQFYETVDLMLIAGSRVRGHETRDFALRLPKRRAQIDVDPAANGRTYSSDYFVCADAELALAALADRLDARGWEPARGYRDEVAALKERARREFREALQAYGSFAEQLRAVMPEDALWVRDITLNNTTWGNRLFPLHGPRDSVYSVGAAIGMGLSHAIGAAVAAPGRKVVAMCGDGGFFLNIAEIWTAAQEKLDITFLVMNDGGYGVIKHIQDVFHEGRHYFADLQHPELQQLAALCGMGYERVSRADALGAAVGRALGTGGPSLVEVDMAAIGPFPPYFRAPEPPKRD